MNTTPRERIDAFIKSLNGEKIGYPTKKPKPYKRPSAKTTKQDPSTVVQDAIKHMNKLVRDNRKKSPRA